MANQENWGVVGGGILGMTLAYRLAQQGKKVTLYESASEVGGLASAWQLGDIVWDRHYHVTLLSDTHLRSLLKELDLEQDLQWVETKTGVYADSKLYSVSNALEFLQFPPLGLIDKLRLGLTIVYASKLKDWHKLEHITVAEWLRRWSGDRTFKKFWLPLLRAKLGDNYQKVSAAFIWAIIARLYAARRTGLKKEMFGYLPGGYARMLKRFAQVLVTAGVKIKLNCAVTQIEGIGGGVRLELSNGKEQILDQVVVTTAAPIAAQICHGLTPREKMQLKAIQYQGIICASVLIKQPLADFYVTNITDSWVPFTGVIEMSALVDKQEFGGHTLVYLPKYVAPDDPSFKLTDKELQAKFISVLMLMYPHLRADDFLSFQVSRVRYVLPISTLNYSQQLPPMTTSIPGVHIINSAHILNGTLNVNETIQLAETAAQYLLSQSKVNSFPTIALSA